MRVSCFLLLYIVFLASACGAPVSPATSAFTSPTIQAPLPAPTQSVTEGATLTASPTLTLPPTPTSTSTHRPPHTPTLTPTLKPRSSPTPTPGTPLTRPPDPAAEWPTPDNLLPLVLGPNLDDIETQIRDYLNAGGSSASLQATLTGLRAILDDGTPVQFNSQVIYQDVTGDTIPDIVMDLRMLFEGDYEGKVSSTVFIFRCDQGQYESFAFGHPGSFLQGPEEGQGLRAVRDMNLNGVPEIIFSLIDNIGVHVNFTRLFRILEWDGTKFSDLVYGPNFYTGQAGNRAYVYNGDGVIGDTNGDGYLELVLTNGIEHYYMDSGPQRERTDFWVWNGDAFVLARWKHPPPVFRIHAIWDGDDASRFGDYAEALAFYQQAIFDESLLGWSPGRLWPDSAYGSAATPTPAPDERPRLNAYARYRILLLHTVEGNMREAQIVYDTLQQKFPSGSVGSQYATLAVAFWEEISASGDIAAACAKAIEYAEIHTDEILSPLGYDVYYQRFYTSADICPFTE